MRRFFVLFVLFMGLSNMLFSQLSQNGKYQYTVTVSNIVSKADVAAVSTALQANADIVYKFGANLKHNFMVIETKTVFTKQKLQSMIGDNYTITDFTQTQLTKKQLVQKIKLPQPFKN